MIEANVDAEERQAERPSSIRFVMIFLATLVAMLLYLDRICISTAASFVASDLQIKKEELDQVLSAFFLTYALGQLPAGWLGDRFGARWMLGGYIVLWSLSTGLIGAATGLQAVLILRYATGLFEAGAYPVAANIVKRWMPIHRRGIASSVVAVGGRLGGALAPILTMQLMLLWTFSNQYFSLAPDAIPSVSSWRPVMVVYGAVGILIGIIFMWFFRDSPAQHRRVNRAEREWIQGGSPSIAIDSNSLSSPSQQDRGMRFPPLLAMAASVPLWLTCFVQFASNFGWAFLVTKMPTYLSEVYGSSPQSQSWLQSIPLAAGIPGLFLGGFFTDLFVRRFGLRWGRSIAMGVSRLAVATAFASTFIATSAEVATLCFVWMSFATDLGTPACWAYCQDVGGKNVGAVLGWANMWGNLGAALSPIAFGHILALYTESTAGWQMVFAICCGINVLASLSALGISAKKAIVD